MCRRLQNKDQAQSSHANGARPFGWRVRALEWPVGSGEVTDLLQEVGRRRGHPKVKCKRPGSPTTWSVQTARGTKAPIAVGGRRKVSRPHGKSSLRDLPRRSLKLLDERAAPDGGGACRGKSSRHVQALWVKSAFADRCAARRPLHGGRRRQTNTPAPLPPPPCHKRLRNRQRQTACLALKNTRSVTAGREVAQGKWTASRSPR